MTQFIECDYCAQNNYPDALCCQWCGAPMPILLPGISPEIKQVLEVKGHEMQTHSTMLCSSTSVPYTELCTTASLYDWEVKEIRADEEARRAWSEGYELPDPPKRGWRERLGIGGK